jgi:hypothetical protein
MPPFIPTPLYLHRKEDSVHLGYRRTGMEFRQKAPTEDEQ